MSRIEFKQPNGHRITMDIWGESMSCYSEEDYKKDPKLRGIFKADLFIEVDYWGDSFHRSYEHTDVTFWFDHKGIYKYRTQKEPFLYWKVQNVEEEYENWHKDDKTGYYSIPLNEPRLIKKNYF